jgi:outer membrane autotransporter protein
MQGFTQGLLSCPRFEGDATLLGEGTCVWARFLGNNTSGSRYQGTSGFDDERRGVQAGGQWELSPNWFVGASWHYEETRIDGSDRRVSTDGTDSAFGLSLKHTAGPWLFAAALGGGMGWYDTDRQIRIPGYAALARDSSEVHSLGARLRAAYEIAGPRWYLRPNLDAELIVVRVPGHRESGAGNLGLAYDSASQTSLAVTPALELGARLDLAGGYILRPFARLGVSLLTNDDWTISARLAGAPAGVPGFETAIPLDQVTTQVSAGLQLWAANGLDLRLGYDGAFSEHATSHGGTLTLAWDF